MQINPNIARIVIYAGASAIYLLAGYFYGRKQGNEKLEEWIERATAFEKEVDRLSALVPLHGKDGKFVKKGKNNE